jgi:predicted transcriptional regulator
MSIHPAYAEAILRGDKQVEFRKRPLAPDVETVVVYATAPVQRVVGAFTIDRTVAGDRDSVWREVGAVGGISRETYDRYFDSSPRAVGLVVGKATRWTALPLTDLDARLTPPQSFAYIPEHLLRIGAPADYRPTTRLARTMRTALHRAVVMIAGLRPHGALNYAQTSATAKSAALRKP